MTHWFVLFFTVSLAILAATVAYVIFYNKSKRIKRGIIDGKRFIPSAFNVFVAGFFLLALAVYFPVYFFGYTRGDALLPRFFQSLVLASQNVLQLVTLNGGMDNVRALAADPEIMNRAFGYVYSSYAAVILIVAPALAATVVLSFFKRLFAPLKYALAPKSDICIFSELNDRSILLAEDLFKNSERRVLIVFANVYDTDDERFSAFTRRTKAIDAILLAKDVLDVSLKPSHSGIERKFYFIGDDEDANVRHALAAIGKCRSEAAYNREGTFIYVFATSAESEALINSVYGGGEEIRFTVRRVNEIQNLVWDTLRSNSFFNDYRLREDGVREINLIIVGLGLYGVEILKAVCWLGQLPGYELNIHVFEKRSDESSSAEAKMRYLAPELIKYNARREEGESYYNIVFHDDIANVKSNEFSEAIVGLKFVTAVFVTLGDDELNIETAMKIRTLQLRQHVEDGTVGNIAKNPAIYTVVYSDAKTESVANGLKDFKGNDYEINFIGSKRSRYTSKIIENRELEKAGAVCHKYFSGGNLKDYEIEYNRCSSMALAMFIDYVQAYLESLGAEERKKLVSDADNALTEEGFRLLKVCEHKRWNAYMRTLGYEHSEKIEEVRSLRDLAKLHYNLVPFGKITEWERGKDVIPDFINERLRGKAYEKTIDD